MATFVYEELDNEREYAYSIEGTLADPHLVHHNPIESAKFFKNVKYEWKTK